MIEIYDALNGKKVAAVIVPAEKSTLPFKRDGWNFDWLQLIGIEHTGTYVLRLVETPKTIEGILQMRLESGMCIMDLVEIAPHNIGQNKRYEYVAEGLISFACRESFKMAGEYKGYLTFVSKTGLIQWYVSKYGAKQAIGQKMYIDPEKGLELIDKYLDK